MASSVTSEYPTPNKPCRCAEGDKNIWTTKASENSDKPPQNCPNCQILKSGTLFLASKGIGWTSWKKRWFVLTRTSLVFYRNDPNALPQKGGEANPTLGGIDLNTSGSVVVKADKKLLTVLFPDGRDGRTFTLKAETSEELQEWKTALENALAQAPSAANVMGQNGILRNEMGDSIEASGEQCKDKRSVQSMVIGRPVLLALEEIDGSPSFLEKALRFIEDYGIKVEGILRQSADVEEVERRVQEYEQGKVEFSAEEDAHVIGDCIKHVLRELPSSPVPASCCTALVEAYRTGRGNRLNAIRAAISETFPDPNRRLLQRILKMMRTVASYRSENRMSPSGLAACMAPLLLRPLLAGDCEFEDDFNMGGDGSIQLLKAAAAANHAQAIVIILLEDYDRIFDEELLHDGSSSEIYTDSEEEVDDDNEDDDDDDGEDDDDDDDVDDIEDDFSTDNDIAEVGGYCDAQNGVEADIEDDFTDSSCGSGTLSRSDSDVGSVSSDDESIEDYSTDSSSPKDTEATDRQSSSLDVITLQKDASENQSTDELTTQHADLKDSVFLDDSNSKISTSQEDKSFGDVDTPTSQMQKCSSNNFPERMAKFHEKSMDSMSTSQRHARWGRAPARKNLSMESMDVPSEDKDAVQRLETIKDDLQDKLAEEVKGNALLQASLERRKEVLHSRQSALEKEVERLRELLQKERDLREALESRLTNKTREEHEETNLAEADIKNLKQKVADLREQLNLHAFCESCNKRLHAVSQSEENNQQKIADSPLLQQNINSSKLDIGSSTLSSEEFHAQIEDPSSTDGEIPQRGPPEQTNQTSFSGYSGLPSTEESSCIGATGIANKFSSTDGSTLSKASHQEVKRESQNISCLPGSQHEKEKLSTKKNRRKSLESGSISYRQEPTEVVKNSAPDTFTSKDENHMSGDDHAKSKPKTQHSHPSSDRRPSKMPQHHEEPTTVACDPSKKSSSGLENSISGDDQESAKVKTQDSRSSADRRPSKNLLPITVGCDSSKKSTSRGENSRTREDHEKAKAKTQDSHPSGDKRPSKNLLPHEDPVTVACDSPKNASSRGENSKSGEDHEKKAKTQSSIPSGDRQPSKNPLPREEPATVACDSPRKATSRDENTMSGEDHENAKAKTQDLPPSIDRRPSKNILLHEEPATVPCDSSKKSTSSGENSMSGDDHESARDKTQDSYASAADWRPSKNELPHEEPAQVSCDSSKSTSRNENPKIGLDAEKLKAQNETPVSSVDKQSSKQPPNTTNQGSKKPVLSQNPSIEEQAAFNRVPASKKTKTWDEMLKEPPHSPSLQKRKPSQKLQPYTSGSNSVKPVGSPEDATVGSSAGFKKPTGSRPEEAPPTSSTALTRLTNRLNFLKERRVQLVNELQNLDANRASGPEHPPSNTR